jgi:UDP-glucuronate 4-epimerase
MKILITGGAGFIGSSLAKTLLKKNIKVVIFDNFNSFYNPVFKKENINSLSAYRQNLSIVEGDILKIADLKKLFKEHQFDKIVHLAAYPGILSSFNLPQLYASNNIQGTLNMLEHARKNSINHFLFGSSSSVYGNLEKTPFKENVVSDSFLSPYAKTKRAGELLCYSYNKNYNINMTIFRFFSVYGPQVRPDMSTYLFTESILNQKTINVFGNGEIQRDFTYIDDAVSAILLGLKKEFPYEEFNIASGKPISLNELIGTLEKITKKKARIKYLEALPFDMPITYGDISKAKKMLGYQPRIDLKEGLSKLVKWFKEDRL